LIWIKTLLPTMAGLLSVENHVELRAWGVVAGVGVLQ
jgi:hypothetical protein